MAFRDKDVAREYIRNWHQRNKVRRMERWKERYSNDQDFRFLRAKYMSEYRERIRAKVFELLGNKCRCCGENSPTLLAVDHIYNDGRNERAGRRAGWKLYKKILESEDSAGRYQILCHSCNMSKHINGGTCEHKTIVWEMFKQLERA